MATLIETQPVDSIAVIVYDGLHLIGKVVRQSKTQIVLTLPLQIKYELVQTGLNPMGGKQVTNLVPYAPLSGGDVTFPAAGLATYPPSTDLRLRYEKWYASKQPAQTAGQQLNG